MTRPSSASFALLSLAGALFTSLAAGCDDAAAPRPDPLIAQIQLITTGTAPVFIYEGCVPELGITKVSPARRDVTPTFACACSCEDSSCRGPVACGACLAQAREIGSATPFAYTWTAVTVATESRGSYSCVRTTNLPAGDYLLQIPTYATAAEAEAHTGGRNVTAVFSLPAAAPVIVDVTAP